MFKNLTTTEFVIIVFVLILLFGGTRLPNFTKGIKEAIEEFKRSTGKN